MLKITNPRLLLAKIRNGDFSHPGETEAIDIVLTKISKIRNADPLIQIKKILDVGCGLGGTADYIRTHTPHDIYGIDIDETALNHAKLYYPKINLFKCNVMDVNKLFNKNEFDIIYMFNVFYAFTDQKNSLARLSSIAKPGAILAIFDYTQAKKTNFQIKDLAGKEINPIHLEDLKTWLDENGWDLIEITDISDKYEKWYSNFLENLESKKITLLNEFAEAAFNQVNHTFSSLFHQIKNKNIGGSIIYGQRNTKSVENAGEKPTR